MRVSRRVVNYFVNFATYGNPNGPPEQELGRGQVYWEPFDEMKHPFLIINRKDKVGYDCPDSWIGAATELGIPGEDSVAPNVQKPRPRRVSGVHRMRKQRKQ